MKTVKLLVVGLGLSVWGGPVPAAPITLHPENAHCFLFRGRPVLLIGSGEHYGAVLNGGFDWRRYLGTLAASGLNYTRLFSGSYVEPNGAFGIQRNTLAPGAGQFIAPWARSDQPGYAGGGPKFDLEQWNPDYFARLKDFVTEAGRRGIVVELTLFSSHYGDAQWAVSPLNPTNHLPATAAVARTNLHTLENGQLLARQEQLTRKLVRELNSFDNLLFEVQNEPWSDRPVTVDHLNPYLAAQGHTNFPNSVELADLASITWQRRVVEWITSEEDTLTNRHLIAQNLCNFRAPLRGAVHAAVSLVNFHYAFPEAAWWNYGLGKALGCDETGFLGRADFPYRKQAWSFLLAGGSTFNHLDYSFTLGHEDGSDTAPNGPGGGSAVLRQQLKVLAEFLQNFDLPALVPDRSTVKSSPGVVVQALSTPGRQYAFYLSGKGPCDLSLNLPAGDYRVEWTRPRTGEKELSTYRHRGGVWVLRSPAFNEDAALRLLNRDTRLQR